MASLLNPQNEVEMGSARAARAILRSAIVQSLLRLRGFCRRHRRADILVRSRVERKEGGRSFQSLGAFGSCCGQECPRAASVAASPRCALAPWRLCVGTVSAY